MRGKEARTAGSPPWSARMGALVMGLAFALAGTFTSGVAQSTGILRGTVTEAGTGRPLANVQISLRDGQRGTLTGANGQYVIENIPAGEANVRAELIGFRMSQQTVNIQNGQTTMADFQLSQAAIDLDEIVVTGTAGRTTRRSIGNSVSTVNAERITEVAPVSNVQDLLNGRTPGVVLQTSTGVVGGSSRIRVRGAGSLSAGNEPVVFIDGVRVQSGTAATVGTTGNTAQGINLLESINPNDIESMEVIKGPAAATLYGAEAAAGVIQIITKKGRPAEGLQWAANFEYGETEWAVDKITNYWLCTTAADNHPLAGNRFTNTNPGCAVFDPSQPLSERLLVDDPFDMSRRSAGVYRQLEAMGLPTDRFSCQYPEQQPCEPRPLRTGTGWNGNLSVRGGGEGYNFYISGERNEENGTFFNNINNRTSVRANFGFVPSSKLNFGVQTGYATTEQRLPLSDNSSNSVLRNAYRGQAGGPRGTYLPGYRGFMPEFSNQYDRKVSAERLTIGLTTNYNPFGWWQNRLTLGLDRNDRENRLFEQIDQTGLFPNSIGDINIAYPLNHIWTIDYAGTLTANIAEEWSSAFSAGMQLNKRRGETVSIDGEGLVTNNLNLVSAAAQRSAGQTYTEQTSLGFFVQEQVGYRDRLFATAAVRVDDNSAFGRDFSLVVYPKASLSWVISEEDFFNVGLIDEMKLRAAWGQAGNAPAPFSADRTYESGRTVIGDAPVNRLITDDYGNPDLKAETGSEIELGFDASFLSGRLGADFTYYRKNTKDALLNVSVPPSSGWTGNYLRNVGEIRNSGVELALNASLIRRRSVQWDMIASIATNSNELVSFGVDADGNPILTELRFGPFIDAQRHREGYPLGGFWATDVVRDASGVPVLNANGTASLQTCNSWPDDCNEEYIGPMLPTRQLGLTNTLTLFDNVRLYVFADYQGGNYQWCAICSIRTRIDRNTAQINDPNLTREQFAYLNSLQTAEFIYPADFIKLREASLTYTLPASMVSRIGFRRASVTVSGRNLWMWTKYDGPSDPEVTFTSTSEFDMADYGSIPMQRRLLFSMNFNF
jgi:TonB-dependent starch-binding outer membrane protein SusC